jgi:hypothetical protein
MYWERCPCKGAYSTQDANMTYVNDSNCLKLVIKSLFKIATLHLVDSNLLYIDIFTAEIYVVTSGSFINLIRLLQIVLKTAGIRVYYRVVVNSEPQKLV